VNSFVKYQLPLIIWAIVIFIESSIPSLHLPEIKSPIGPDKIAHFCVFFVFALLSYRALFFQSAFPKLKNHAIVITLIITSLYGYLDELHQFYVVGRSYDMYDWMADTLGALVYLGIVFFQRQNAKCHPVSTDKKIQ